MDKLKKVNLFFTLLFCALVMCYKAHLQSKGSVATGNKSESLCWGKKGKLIDMMKLQTGHWKKGRTQLSPVIQNKAVRKNEDVSGTKWFCLPWNILSIHTWPVCRFFSFIFTFQMLKMLKCQNHLYDFKKWTTVLSFCEHENFNYKYFSQNTINTVSPLTRLFEHSVI